MAKIVVFGAGLMGSAFSVPLADNGHDVSLVGTYLDGDEIEEMHQTHVHPRLGCHLPESIKPLPHLALPKEVEDADLVVLGVNSEGVDHAAEQLGSILKPDTPVIMLTKGLYGTGQGLQILPERFRSQLSAPHRDQIQINAVGGPSIAGELAVRRHTSVVLTGPDKELLDKLAGYMRTPYYHVQVDTDVLGVETGVSMKNIYALTVGIVDGIMEVEPEPENDAVMYNMAAAIFAQSLYEMNYMLQYVGANTHHIYHLTGVGDLYVTSQGGRNRRMGRLLGMGMKYADAKAQHMPDTTIEGALMLQAIGLTVEQLVSSGELDPRQIPLLRMMIDTVVHNQQLVVPWESFFGGT